MINNKKKICCCVMRKHQPACEDIILNQYDEALGLLSIKSIQSGLGVLDDGSPSEILEV